MTPIHWSLVACLVVPLIASACAPSAVPPPAQAATPAAITGPRLPGKFVTRGEGVTRQTLFVFDTGEEAKVVDIDGRRAIEYVGSEGGAPAIHVIYFEADGSLPALRQGIARNRQLADELLREARAQISPDILEACVERIRGRYSANTTFQRVSAFAVDEGTARMDPTRGVVYEATYALRLWTGAVSFHDIRCWYAYHGGQLTLSDVRWVPSRNRRPLTVPG